MNKLIIILLVLFPVQYGFCQAYQADFLKYFNHGNTKKQYKVLKKWEAESPHDVALYTSFFNYHIVKARELAKDTIRYTDGAGTVAIFRSERFALDELEKGFKKIDEGIERYPNRLDMRFGKIFLLGQIPDWEAFTKEIIKTVEYSSQNKNAWTLQDNVAFAKNDEDFLDAIHKYQIGLFDTGDTTLIQFIEAISNAVTTYYPDHLDNLITLSTCHLLKRDFEKGIEALLKANTINPNDYVLLGKIAEAYKLKGDYELAIEYYKKTYTLGNERAVAYARQQVKLLSDKALNIGSE